MRLAGIEPANPKGVPDFKSGAYTKFRHKRRQPHKQQGQKHIQLSNTHPITSTDLWVSTSDLCGHPRFSAIATIPSRECAPQGGLGEVSKYAALRAAGEGESPSRADFYALSSFPKIAVSKPNSVFVVSVSR